MSLTREKIESGYLQAMLRDNSFGLKPLTEAELLETRRQALAGADVSQGLWLFAYGSLLWNPAIDIVEERAARIHGYHRRFCLWTPLGRGTPEKPGLVLGLDRGGSCSGRVLRIAADQVSQELAIVWKREMVTGSYQPKWVVAETEDGPVRALTFVMRRDRSNYAGDLDEDQVADVLAEAEGALGTAREYLFSTLDCLQNLGIKDRPLTRLGQKVRALIAGED